MTVVYGTVYDAVPDDPLAVQPPGHHKTSCAAAVKRMQMSHKNSLSYLSGDACVYQVMAGTRWSGMASKSRRSPTERFTNVTK